MQLLSLFLFGLVVLLTVKTNTLCYSQVSNKLANSVVYRVTNLPRYGSLLSAIGS